MSYTPSPPPNELTVQSVWDEFNKLRNFIESMEVDYISLRVHNVAPNKPKTGVLYYADGSNWNPGAGKGVYEYDGTTFNKL